AQATDLLEVHPGALFSGSTATPVVVVGRRDVPVDGAGVIGKAAAAVQDLGHDGGVPVLPCTRLLLPPVPVRRAEKAGRVRRVCPEERVRPGNLADHVAALLGQGDQTGVVVGVVAKAVPPG